MGEGQILARATGQRSTLSSCLNWRKTWHLRNTKIYMNNLFNSLTKYHITHIWTTIKIQKYRRKINNDVVGYHFPLFFHHHIPRKDRTKYLSTCEIEVNYEQAKINSCHARLNFTEVWGTTFLQIHWSYHAI